MRDCPKQGLYDMQGRVARRIRVDLKRSRDQERGSDRLPSTGDCQYNTMPTRMRPGMQRFSSGESGGRRRKTDSEYSPHVGMQTAAHFLNRLMPPSVEFSLLGVELLPRIQPFRVKVEIVHLPHRLRDFKPGG